MSCGGGRLGARPADPGDHTADELVDELVRTTVALLAGATHAVQSLVLGRSQFRRLFDVAAGDASASGRTELARYFEGIGRWVDAAGAFSDAGTHFAETVGLPIRPDGPDAVAPAVSLLRALRIDGHQQGDAVHVPSGSGA